MENNPTQYPVLVACHDLGKLREEILRHFQNHRVNADLRPFASLPSAEETAEKYLAVLYLPELSVKTQTERAIRLGKQAGLPCFSVTRQSAGWGKALSTFMPPEDSTPRPQMLEFLRVVGDGKPWGWHRLVLSLHPAFQGDGAVPPAVQCSAGRTCSPISSGYLRTSSRRACARSATGSTPPPLPSQPRRCR